MMRRTEREGDNVETIDKKSVAESDKFDDILIREGLKRLLEDYRTKSTPWHVMADKLSSINEELKFLVIDRKMAASGERGYKKKNRA